MKNANKQQGAVLITVLSFLMIMTLIGLTNMKTSTTELRLATNQQERLAATHIAQAASDNVIDEVTNFVVSGTEGTEKTDATFSGILEFTETDVTITELERTPPPRGSGMSADKFTTALFTVDSAYNGLTKGRGQARVVQGVMILVSESSQSNQ